jgi:hypothetical protein
MERLTPIRIRLVGYTKLVLIVLDNVCNVKMNGVSYDKFSRYDYAATILNYMIIKHLVKNSLKIDI